MRHNQLEFFNAAEVEESRCGVRMYRFPRAVCDAMGATLKDGENKFGRYVSQTTTGCEIRFVTDGDRARIALTSLDYNGYVQVFCGDFAYYEGYTYQFPVQRDRVTIIELKRPKLLDTMNPALQQVSFAPQVWRIMSGINMTLAMVDFEGFGFNVRPPKPEEVPAKTLLCYGTSLTFGACANAHGIAYVQLLGRLLGCNIMNKAMGGSCMNEPGVADYFASGQEHFNSVLLENGVNMSGSGDLYRERTSYLLKKLTKAYPNMPIYCVTAYPNQFNIVGDCPVPCLKDTNNPEARYQNDRIIREIVKEYPSCKLIEGAEMMDHSTDLTIDGIHLSDYGHIRVAQNLAKRIELSEIYHE
ncbi:MAG: hypothetical protein IJZ34_02790 [Lachnospiraceae bacterium]|nr:hypothetical protein [Lachnospiraceae bacterium]